MTQDDGTALPGFFRRIARGLGAARATIGTETIAESLPVAIGTGLARPVIERRVRRADGTERYVLVLPFGEGETRIEMLPHEFEALSREMVRFWNEQVTGSAAQRVEAGTTNGDT